MSSQQDVTTARPQTDGASALAERVLSTPEHGSGYFFPATSSGTPLALAGFAFSLALLSIVNTEWINLTSLGILLPVAFSYGTLALVLGGLWEFRANNLFGATWTISYGSFWLSLALLLQFFAGGIVSATGPEGFLDAFAAYLVLWGIFSGYMTVAAWYVARPAFLAFLLLAAVFFILAVANFYAPGDFANNLRKAGGYVGIVDAAVAWYVSAALVINVTSGRTLLPLWPYTRR